MSNDFNVRRKFFSDVVKVTGGGLIGMTLPAIGAEQQTVPHVFSERINVKDFGATGEGKTPDTNAIQDAIDYAATIEGTVLIPAGEYHLDQPITVPSGVSIQGEGRRNGTKLIATHNGSAIMNLKGSGHVSLRDFVLTTDSTIYPKTGVLMGRSSSASAGHHNISNIRIQGKFSEAAIYSIASEVNTWSDIYVWMLGGGAKYAFYTSKSDDLNVDNLITSTNLVNTLTSMYLINSSQVDGAACIHIEASESMGSWSFYNAYLIAAKGAYVEIHNESDAQCLGPLSFFGCSGERLSESDPTYGFKISSSVACNFKGLTITSSRFDLLGGDDHFTFWTDSNCTFTTPNIILQPPEAFPYAESKFFRSKIKGGLFKVARDYQWIKPTLIGTWINHYGSPYAPAGYTIDGEGRVQLRGTLYGGIGSIFTLPDNYRPANNMFFTTSGNGALARVLIDASNGTVSLYSGSGKSLDLNGISFIAEK